MRLTFATLFTIPAMCIFVSAAPLQLRDVFVPPILAPTKGAVWKIGTKQVVKWDTRRAPAKITNRLGMVVLVHKGLLDMKNPLAVDFDILTGKETVIVPKVVPGNDYQIIVFGDSGNSSPKFSITD